MWISFVFPKLTITVIAIGARRTPWCVIIDEVLISKAHGNSCNQIDLDFDLKVIGHCLLMPADRFE